ncbi:GTPase domain-containing protein [Actinomyces minihominis]|uniref:GTPase domain-containing protein n=1 Tax=Actinomyces minihominis TaxID=2002838 RepID=UPI000C07D1CC|nr:GTPase domain-containing protein [Actinomyces minihominis]
MIQVARELERLQNALRTVSLPVATPSAGVVASLCFDLAQQLEDYILPRYRSLDAPLLAVIGGSTGSGKSLIINSLVREKVALSTAIRPTTRHPLLLHAGGEGEWFEGPRILPGLPRVAQEGSREAASIEPGGDTTPSQLQLAPHVRLPRGLALLDSPDIDSVVEHNRVLAGQLLAAADLWIFVTTAARYSDAIPWNLLHEAAARNIVLAVVLNRIPIGVEDEVVPDLRARLSEAGLGDTPVFPIAEALDPEGFIPEPALLPLGEWINRIAVDATIREGVARQTLEGATSALLSNEEEIVAALQEQAAAIARMESAVKGGLSLAEHNFSASLADGTLLRAEVISRWQEIVGTGEWMRRLERGISSLRDRVTGWIRARGAAPAMAGFEDALEDSLLVSLVATSEEMIAGIESQWAMHPDSEKLLTAVETHLRTGAEREGAAARLIREWQRELVELVSTTGRDKRAMARVLAVGVNVLGAALIIVIFASTAGLTGAEIAVAGGTAVAAQRVLEAIFGDDAVRRMATRAREDLVERTTGFLAADAAVFEKVMAELGVGVESPGVVRDSFAAVRRALEEEGER